METRKLKAGRGEASVEAVRAAAEALAAGRLVVFPTETVYGLGASGVHAEAVRAMHALKDRDAGRKPFTLHIADPGDAERYTGPLPRAARALVRKAWPGPVMLVLPDRRPEGAGPEGLVEESVYFEGTVGLRCVADPVGRAILREAGVPVLASSANLAGHPPPRKFGEAMADLDGRVAVAVDAGPTAYKRPSTVVRVGGDGKLEVLREGAVAAQRIERLARTRLLFVCTGNQCRSPMAEGLARHLLAERLGTDPELLPAAGFEVASAGVAAGSGAPASDHAVTAMLDRGVDIRRHRSAPATVDAMASSDYIYCLTEGHRRAVLQIAPEVADRVRLLDPQGRDIADPIGGTLDQYRATAREIEQAVARRVAEVVE